MKNVRVFFISKYFQFLEVKLSAYLNRRVFVIDDENDTIDDDNDENVADGGI